MSLPVICWIQPGVKAQLQEFASSQGICTELCAGELVTQALRAHGVPPADPVPVDIAVARRVPLPEGVMQHLRTIDTDPESMRNRSIRRNAKTKGE